MSDKMTPIGFGKLMNWILAEEKKGSIFGIKRPFKAKAGHEAEIFGHKLETPFGPAAGPHTQLAQNIIAAYVAGSRFFELKTVQKIDGDDLPVAKPCIKADDECYNVEWSTELYVPQAYDEYLKAWFALKVISKEFGLGAMDGFQFNMSVGYDLAGIKLPKLDKFIEELKDASQTPIFKECQQWLLDNLNLFQNLTKEDVLSISPEVCNSATISTLHGCPPQEIESIANHLLVNKKLNTFIKCNPTLLGYEYARKTLDEMGYDYVAFGDFHFKDDLQYDDAVPMLERLQVLADKQKLAFGVKITNTFPVDIKQKELPGQEMYMSGKSLYALSLSAALRLSKSFKGKLRIAYSGGADAFNIGQIVDTGVWPVTMATNMLKPGGYQRLEQIGQLFAKKPVPVFKGVDVAKLEALVAEAKVDPHRVKAVKPLPSRKIKEQVPLTDCFFAPCKAGCPIHQDITAYLQLVSAGKKQEALEVILEKNPLPFITGTICAHNCMSKCTRNFYETPVNIRKNKLVAAEGGFDKVIKNLKKGASVGKTAVVVGGGPAGMAAAYLLSRGGVNTTILEKTDKLGGVVRHVIPEFRITADTIDHDVELLKAMGVKVELEHSVKDISGLTKEYDYVILAIGAHLPGTLPMKSGEALNALEFLGDFKASDGKVNLGKKVIVIGGGNTAMDTARAAKRNAGVEEVSLVYRRTKRYMPADAEELEMAVEDGVKFAELLSPETFANGKLLCQKMKLGEYDSKGRRSVEATGETVELAADTVIAAVGEKVNTDFYRQAGITVDEKGKAKINAETMAANLPGVYVVGDGASGPSTVVEGIASATRAVQAILGHPVAEDHFIKADEKLIALRKGTMSEETAADCKRCLNCDSYCENCTEVCPNRANIAVTVPGMASHQIVHVDYMCNECGNCKSFCPWDSAPYKDKLTLFANKADMANSENQGFTVVDKAKGLCSVRLDGKTVDYTLGTKSADVPEGVAKIMETVVADYAYML